MKPKASKARRPGAGSLQGRVVLRLTVRQAVLLSDTLMATVRECDVNSANRPTIRLCDRLYRQIQNQTGGKRHNTPHEGRGGND